MRSAEADNSPANSDASSDASSIDSTVASDRQAVAGEADFAGRVLDWAREYGRHDLPWQQQPTPYRVWVSEIMLQQTQVTTVIPYFQRFTERFPDLQSLAAASVDDVLHLWSGLGYYARARNLHRAAELLVEHFQGTFPATLAEMVSLPGMGRSTAGAVLSLAMGQSQAILDGNVKRVLARHFMVDGWPGQAAVLKRLWALAECLTPDKDCALYNQAMMDLGSMVCTRGRPACQRCPVQQSCLAKGANSQADYPFSKPRKNLPVRQVAMLAIRNQQGQLLLQQRPPTGIWGGLWSLPELPVGESAQLVKEVQDSLGLAVGLLEQLPVRRHTFSHFHLDIHPFSGQLLDNDGRCVAETSVRWVSPGKVALGLAAPVSRLLQEINFVMEPI